MSVVGGTEGRLEQQRLFVSGEGGYHTYRIPALALSTRGTLLAFCEGRRDGRGDAGRIDLLLRRSEDGGGAWGEVQRVVAEEGMTCGNPCPVVDRATGTIWLPFCKNLAAGDEGRIVRGKAPRTVWVTHSDDDGQTWAKPVEITEDVKVYFWTWYATGPGHGIQLDNERLIVPCDHIEGLHFDRQRDPYRSHIIYSDDHGASWRIGGVGALGTNECAAVQTVDGAVYLNSRNYMGAKRRAVAWSMDRGNTLADFGWDEQLVEPVCQASLMRYTVASVFETGPDKNRVLFANPASVERERLTVRISEDECRTWSPGKPLYEGPSAYSDLAIAPDGLTICCLYECGVNDPYEGLTLARFDLAWLTDGWESR